MSNYLKVRVRVLRIYEGASNVIYVCKKVGNKSILYELPNGTPVYERLPEFIIKQSQIDCGIIEIFEVD